MTGNPVAPGFDAEKISPVLQVSGESPAPGDFFSVTERGDGAVSLSDSWKRRLKVIVWIIVVLIACSVVFAPSYLLFGHRHKWTAINSKFFTGSTMTEEVLLVSPVNSGGRAVDTLQYDVKFDYNIVVYPLPIYERERLVEVGLEIVRVHVTIVGHDDRLVVKDRSTWMAPPQSHELWWNKVFFSRDK